MDAEFVAFLVIILLGALGGSYFTILFCRMAGERVRWYWAVLGAISSGLFVAAVVWFGLSLGHGGIGKGATVGTIVCWAWSWACGSAILPGFFTLLYFRRRFFGLLVSLATMLAWLGGALPLDRAFGFRCPHCHRSLTLRCHHKLVVQTGRCSACGQEVFNEV